MGEAEEAVNAHEAHQHKAAEIALEVEHQKRTELAAKTHEVAVEAARSIKTLGYPTSITLPRIKRTGEVVSYTVTIESHHLVINEEERVGWEISELMLDHRVFLLGDGELRCCRYTPTPEIVDISQLRMGTIEWVLDTLEEIVAQTPKPEPKKKRWLKRRAH